MIFACAARCIIILFNIIFMITGIGLAIGGGILAWNTTVISTIIDPHLTTEQEEIVMDILDGLQFLGLGLFSAGMVILILCLLGVVGACMNSRCILAVYLTLHTILLIAELIVVIIFASKPELIYDQLKLLMETKTMNYVSDDSADGDSKLMSLLMKLLSCCGTNGGADFVSSTKFERNINYNGNNVTLDYPVACCKQDSGSNPSAACPVTFSASNSNINEGCWPVLKSAVEKYANIILYVSIAVMILQILDFYI
ncbi:tetraspanin-1 [Clonorchis sinensis]|uniref:Tetraspanin n=1 Tax=Clonorchis sinensis TaxID=79923 RepID=G7YL39_CLOSI|nr:tetraspanin-1 [Clonorchis sinensis]